MSIVLIYPLRPISAGVPVWITPPVIRPLREAKMEYGIWTRVEKCRKKKQCWN